MAADQPDSVVITSDSVDCEDDCVSGSFTWTPGSAIQELLEELARDNPEVRTALEEIMAARAHDFLVAVAAAAVTYVYDDDGSMLERAQSLLEDTAIELNAQFGVMEIEATLAISLDEEPGPNPDAS